MIVYGAGGLGREVRAEIGGELASDDEYPPEKWPAASLFVVAVGDGRLREKMAERATKLGHRYAACRSLDAHIPGRYRHELPSGVLIMANATLTTDIQIGRGVLANIGCTIGHDCILGDFSSVQPGANLTGRVELEKYAYVGIGATVVCRKGRIVIGEGATIGAGAVVIDDVPRGQTVVGNPARQVA